MRVVGKSSVQKGNTKALMRFFLFNGEHYYRLIMWEARLFRENTTDLCDLYYQLKIGSVSFFVLFVYVHFTGDQILLAPSAEILQGRDRRLARLLEPGARV